MNVKIKDEIMKCFIFTAISAGISILPLFADPIDVPSEYDAATETWIGSVAALTNALKTCKAGDTIRLARGVYDVTSLTNAPLGTSSNGHALLALTKDNLTLIGATGNPNDVIIKAEGFPPYSILSINNTGGAVRDVTISGGYAYTGASVNLRSGGGVHFLVENAMVSNCVITACKSSAQGGAVAGIYDKPPKGVCIDCLFHGNNYTANKGMVGYLTTFRNCIFSNNVIAAAVKDNYSGSITQSCRNYDCLFIYNQAEGCGGARGGVSVNCRFLFNSGLNPAGNNWGNPGGGAARDAVLTNCYFYGNVAYRLGGAIRGGKVVGCTVESNTVFHASDSHGGGMYGATLVESSTIVSNLVTKRGGGLANCSGVTNCYIAFNAAYGTSTTQGGGLSACGTITNCVVEYNMCKSGEGGGGMYDTGAHGSIFRFNGGEHFTKDSAARSFTDCEFVGSCLRGPELMDRCRMHHMSNQVDLVDNVKYGPCRRSFPYAIVNAKTVRNCLFDHAWITNGANNAIFYASGAVPMRVENCSFVSNVTYMTLRGYSAADRTAAFVNCLMTGNRRGNNIYDVTGYQSSYTVFTNCWIGYKDIAQNAAMANSELNIMGKTWNPRFTGDADHPCSPKLRAPYVGKGLVMDWMADATDLRGNPRLRNGLVDVGAYQCWLNPDATTIILR